MATISAAVPATAGLRSAERTFHATMGFAILGAVLIGFSRSFYLHALFPAYPAPR